MTEKLKGIPFDANEIILPDGSAGYDNVLYSADFAEWMQTYFKNGILVPGGALISTEMQATKVDDTHVKVAPGNIVVNGRTAFITEPISLEINKTGPDLERIDRIIIELNLDNTVNCFRLMVVEGTMVATGTATAPDLVRTDEKYQMSLATIKAVQSGISTITDDRSNDSLCGISQVLIGVRPPLPVTGDSADNISYDNTSSGLNATTVQGAIDALVSPESVVSLTAAGWGTDNTQTVSLQGMTAGATVIVDVVAETKQKARLWGRIWKVETLANSLKFYASEALSEAISVKVKVVR